MQATAVSLSSACDGTAAAFAAFRRRRHLRCQPRLSDGCMFGASDTPRRGSSDAQRPVTPRALSRPTPQSAFGASVAGSVTTATAVPSGADHSDSLPSLPLCIRDHREAHCLFRISSISFSEHYSTNLCQNFDRFYTLVI